jgi:Spy/CpxP family protein refolding chaperone
MNFQVKSVTLFLVLAMGASPSQAIKISGPEGIQIVYSRPGNPNSSYQIMDSNAGHVFIPSVKRTLGLPNLTSEQKQAIQKIYDQIDKENERTRKILEEDRALRRAGKIPPVDMKLGGSFEFAKARMMEIKGVLTPEQYTAYLNLENTMKHEQEQALLRMRNPKVLTRTEVFASTQIPNKSKQALKEIYKTHDSKLDALNKQFDLLRAQEWKEIRAVLTKEQLSNLSDLGSEPPWIYWYDSRRDETARETIGFRPYDEKSNAKKINPVISDLSDQQLVTLRAIIKQFRAKFDDLNSKREIVYQEDLNIVRPFIQDIERIKK